jgi:hypothetical protein
MLASAIRWKFTGLSSFLDASAERLAESGLVIILALVKAWNVYTDRRDKRRSGRRESDRSNAQLRRSITRLEAIAAELAAGLARLTTRVAALERHDTRPEE